MNPAFIVKGFLHLHRNIYVSRQIQAFLTNFDHSLLKIDYNFGISYLFLFKHTLTVLTNRRAHVYFSAPTRKDPYTGWERLIRSHSSARFCFELSGNSN